MLANIAHPLGLSCREFSSSDDSRYRLAHPLLRRKKRRGFTCRTLDHRDDIDQRFLMRCLKSPLQICFRKMLGGLSEHLAKLSQRRGPPLTWAGEENGKRLDFRLMLAHKLRKNC